MPLYVYHCPEGHEFEYIRPIDHRDRAIFCPVKVREGLDFEDVSCEAFAERIVVPPTPPHIIIH